MEQSVVAWKYKPHQGSNVGIFLSSFTLLTIPWIVWAYLKTRSTEYRIEGDKLYVRQGVLGIKEQEVYLHRIKSVQPKKSLSNLLGLHALVISTENDLVPEVRIKGIDNLSETENIILRQINLQKGSMDTDTADDP